MVDHDIVLECMSSSNSLVGTTLAWLPSFLPERVMWASLASLAPRRSRPHAEYSSVISPWHLHIHCMAVVAQLFDIRGLIYADNTQA